MNNTTCPRCGSTNVYRETRRVPWCIGGRAWWVAGWYGCREPDCWYKWDGIVDHKDGVLPAGVVARGKPSWPAMMTEEEAQ